MRNLTFSLKDDVDSSMKIALFTDSDVFAGTERHMLDLATGLRRAGRDVRIACPVPSVLQTHAASAGLHVIPIQKGGHLDHAAICTLARLLRSGEINVVHSHNGRTALLAALAVKLAGKGCTVATQHFLEPAHTARRGVKGLLSGISHRWVNRNTNHLIAISEATKQAMIRRRQAQSEKISVVRNGMPNPDLGLRAHGLLCEELGVEPGALLIICAARLELEKSIVTLVEAMEIVAATDRSVVCLIAGEGSQRANLQEHITASGLGERVQLLGFRSDVLALMNAADLFVLPSPVESFGLVLLEAMSVGTPVIAIRAGGPIEIVVDGESGLLVPPNNPEDLARAILSLLEDAALRDRMGAAGRARFLEKFTLERMARETLDVYRKALGQ